MNQVLQDTIAARDLLASKGWMPFLLRDRTTDQHCAVGAILDTVMADGVCGTGSLATGFSFSLDPRTSRLDAVLRELVRSIPGAQVGPLVINWNKIVDYNNSMGEQVVMDMFNTTIARLTKIEAKELVSDKL
jgi:hypothetical protein